MDFKTGDILKIKDEVLEKTKRQRNRGKDVEGWWIPFAAIKAGREKREFEVVNNVGVELYLKWKNENDKYIYYWIHEKHFELKEIAEAEDW